jgi:hypothetical protein
MNKPENLRQHLLVAIPHLRRDPDRLLIFIDEGRLRCTAAPGLSFEYEYSCNLILTDYAGHPDAIAVPLFAWLRVHQPELLTNLEKSRGGVRFEADILDKSKVDLSITLPLSERVIVKEQGDGSLHVEHVGEPQPPELYGPMNWELYAKGELLAAWETPV